MRANSTKSPPERGSVCLGQYDLDLSARDWETRRLKLSVFLFARILVQNLSICLVVVVAVFGLMSGLMNPYGVWSPRAPPSEASSSEMEFGTAREYDTTDLFFGENWLYDDHLFHTNSDGDEGNGEDKFIVGADSTAQWSETRELDDCGGRHQVHTKSKADAEACAEVYTCSSAPCSCCYGGRKNDDGLTRDSCSAVYGRYLIMDDQTEVLDECGADAFLFTRDGDAMLKSEQPIDSKGGDIELLDMSTVEKELQMLSPYLAEADALESEYFLTCPLNYVQSCSSRNP